MSSKTKIIVLHLKELIYTGIFVILGILFVILLVVMFLPGKKTTPDAGSSQPAKYNAGKYTTSLILGNSAVDVEVVVDDDNINSIRLVNLDEAVTTMYPLMQPSLDGLASQIYEKQSLEDINYSDDNKYTSKVLLDAIASALSKAGNKAAVTQDKNRNSTNDSNTNLNNPAQPDNNAELNNDAAPAPNAELNNGAPTPNAEPNNAAAPDSNAELNNGAAPDNSDVLDGAEITPEVISDDNASNQPATAAE